MHYVPNWPSDCLKLCEAVPSKAPIKFIMDFIPKIEAHFLGKVAIVHRQEAVIINGKGVAELVLFHPIDVLLLPHQNDELTGVKDLEVDILALEQLKKKAVSIEFLAE